MACFHSNTRNCTNTRRFFIQHSELRPCMACFHSNTRNSAWGMKTCHARERVRGLLINLPSNFCNPTRRQHARRRPSRTHREKTTGKKVNRDNSQSESRKFACVKTDSANICPITKLCRILRPSSLIFVAAIQAAIEGRYARRIPFC